MGSLPVASDVVEQSRNSLALTLLEYPLWEVTAIVQLQQARRIDRNYHLMQRNGSRKNRVHPVLLCVDPFFYGHKINPKKEIIAGAVLS